MYTMLDFLGFFKYIFSLFCYNAFQMYEFELQSAKTASFNFIKHAWKRCIDLLGPAIDIEPFSNTLCQKDGYIKFLFFSCHTNLSFCISFFVILYFGPLTHIIGP